MRKLISTKPEILRFKSPVIYIYLLRLASKKLWLFPNYNVKQDQSAVRCHPNKGFWSCNYTFCLPCSQLWFSDSFSPRVLGDGSGLTLGLGCSSTHCHPLAEPQSSRLPGHSPRPAFGSAFCRRTQHHRARPPPPGGARAPLPPKEPPRERAAPQPPRPNSPPSAGRAGTVRLAGRSTRGITRRSEGAGNRSRVGKAAQGASTAWQVRTVTPSLARPVAVVGRGWVTGCGAHITDSWWPPSARGKRGIPREPLKDLGDKYYCIQARL